MLRSRFQPGLAAESSSSSDVARSIASGLPGGRSNANASTFARVALSMTSFWLTALLQTTISGVSVLLARPIQLRSRVTGRYVGTRIASNRAWADAVRDSSSSPACDSLCSGI